jgi:hypothetical protein
MEKQFVLGQEHYFKVTIFLEIFIYIENIGKKDISQNEYSFKTNNSQWYFGQFEQGAKRPKRQKKY